MTRLRWGDSAPSGAAAARDRLVDAAEACIDRFGVGKTTLDDVATEARVSRATVYRYFQNRDELVLEVDPGEFPEDLNPEIGQQLGYLNAATVGAINFILLILVGVAFAHKAQTRALFGRLLHQVRRK